MTFTDNTATAVCLDWLVQHENLWARHIMAYNTPLKEAKNQAAKLVTELMVLFTYKKQALVTIHTAESTVVVAIPETGWSHVGQVGAIHGRAMVADLLVAMAEAVRELHRIRGSEIELLTPTRTPHV